MQVGTAGAPLVYGLFMPPGASVLMLRSEDGPGAPSRHA